MTKKDLPKSALAELIHHHIPVDMSLDDRVRMSLQSEVRKWRCEQDPVKEAGCMGKKEQNLNFMRSSPHRRSRMRFLGHEFVVDSNNKVGFGIVEAIVERWLARLREKPPRHRMPHTVATSSVDT